MSLLRWKSISVFSFCLVLILVGTSLNAQEKSAQDSRTAVSKSEKKKILFLAGRPSHGYMSHEHYAGCMLLAKSIEQATDDVETIVLKHNWPKSDDAFDGVDCIVMYCDGGGGHPVNKHLEQVDKLAKKGVGIVCIHYGVEVPKGKSGDKFLEWIGGYFETHWSVNPHWTAEFKEIPEHAITRGVKPFEIKDEWYFNMRFLAGLQGNEPGQTDGVTFVPILVAQPSGEVRDGHADARRGVGARSRLEGASQYGGG